MKKNDTTSEPSIHRVRYESFGGIISSIDPPFLAWVDKGFMRKLGYCASPLWEKKGIARQGEAFLSAPTEVHWAVTNRCSNGCLGCYKDSQPSECAELSTDALKASLKSLRDLGVFHVALGGGEAFTRSDLHEIVLYSREIGLVPNLTTNGLSIGKHEIEICKLMGQVNISCDAVGKDFSVNGRNGSFEQIENAIRALKHAAVSVGINCVVSRNNFYFLEKIVEFAAREGLNEVEFLKIKPSGRAKQWYAANALTQEMIRAFYPMLMRFNRPDSLELKIDCSFVPAVLYHKPEKSDLEKCAVSGCDAGNMLLSVKSDGVFAGCSFVDNSDNDQVSKIGEQWSASRHLNRFRQLVASAQKPCRSCRYLSLCRCGCRATAGFYTNDFFAPDPECPFVFDYTHRQSISKRSI